MRVLNNRFCIKQPTSEFASFCYYGASKDFINANDKYICIIAVRGSVRGGGHNGGGSPRGGNAIFTEGDPPGMRFTTI